MITTAEIVRDYLVGNGYDGLFNMEVGCSCDKEEVFACEDYAGDCEPCYLHKEAE